MALGDKTFDHISTSPKYQDDHLFSLRVLCAVCQKTVFEIESGLKAYRYIILKFNKENNLLQFCFKPNEQTDTDQKHVETFPNSTFS